MNHKAFVNIAGKGQFRCKAPDVSHKRPSDVDMNLIGREICDQSPDWHDSAHPGCLRMFFRRAHRTP